MWIYDTKWSQSEIHLKKQRRKKDRDGDRDGDRKKKSKC